MPQSQVYQITQEIWAATEKLTLEHPALAEMADREFVCRDLPIPLHPGAWEFYEAVSYTHLDVYKRQAPDRPAITAPVSLESGRYWPARCPYGEKRAWTGC